MKNRKRNLIIVAIVVAILMVIAIVVATTKDNTTSVSNSDVIVGSTEVGVDEVESNGNDVESGEVVEPSDEDSKDEALEDGEYGEVIDSTTTPEPTVEPTPVPHEHAYDEGVVVSEATCTSLGLKRFTCECGETYDDAIEMVNHELGEYVYDNNATYEKDGTESATCKVCGNVVDTRTKEGTMLVKEPEPVVVPSGLDTTIGSDLGASGNTITSHNGISLATLNKFNNAGLYNPPTEYVDNYSWFGYFDENGTSASDPSTQNVVDNLLNIKDTCGFLQGFSVWNDTIYVYFNTGGAAGELELKRHSSEGYYTIAINYEMNQGVGSITVEDGRDALLGLCAMISSTPSELEDAIYRDCFGGGDAFISESGWTTIGDCDVQWAGYNVYGFYSYRVKAH